MSIVRRTSVVFVLVCSTTLFAETLTPTITAAARRDVIRVLGSLSVCQMRAQVLSPGGDVLVESGWHDGNLLDVNAAMLTTGSYRCIIEVRDVDGAVTSRAATLVVDAARIAIEGVAGPADPKITVVMHDGENGSIVSSSGDLTFRFGDVLAGTDAERMRVTRDGKVGIGTQAPQAPLDVNGLIRTNRGIEFPDGTILTTAAGLPGVAVNADTDPTDGDRRIRPTIMLRHPVNAPPAGAERGPLKPRLSTPPPDYQFRVDGTGVHIGTSAAYGLNVAGDVTLQSRLNLPATFSSSEGVITLNGSRFLHAFGNGSGNVFLGSNAGNFLMDTFFAVGNVGVGDLSLFSLTSGSYNTAVGFQALQATTTGADNVAVGLSTMYYNTTGANNTAVGSVALGNNQTGNQNAALGRDALYLNVSGSSNTAIGYQSLYNNTGSTNTAIGNSSLYSNASGTGNIALGVSAGGSIQTGSNDIIIGNFISGSAAESNTTRIGSVQTRAFIAGISGVIPGGASPVGVVVDSNGQLGVVPSSRRYKFDINDAGHMTDSLMRLRPVTFRYRAHGPDGPLQYGLIAEEVAEVYPELVARNAEGEAETVMYQFLPPMLLNEVQKLHRRIEEKDKTIDELRATVDALAARMQALETRFAPR